ncbi:deoxyribodipyrimidine photo-lyase [Lewinella marina]|uniref:Deoxyribodipyrimidine photo-lyase n=1 Tax=Neolewinella marina TaxID=438751 RepID=A0A2G0CAW9_9BACT|nr:deoxyribodipyrimidine photo-lyase [Neolewinella marina]NJB85874.1 deoxyribodipyrimidine photo-lyase [Neolewinella marina]PHK97112.1 deoxyribodipyrimidine photolyase [Neolewinella marina]
MDDLKHFSIAPERIRQLNDQPLREDGRYVVYWMQESMRAWENPALEYAIRWANDLDKACVVVFTLIDDFPEANLRHYRFLLEGLKEVADRVAERELKFVLLHGDRVEKITAFASANDVCAVVTDRAYLRHERGWRAGAAERLDVPLVQVEGNVVVPVETASNKREYAARTIRKKIMERVDEFSGETTETEPLHASKDDQLDSDLDFTSVDAVLDQLKIDRSVPPSPDFTGGTSEARRRLTSFLRSDLKGYGDGRLDPADDATSHLSPYLHFGHISPCEILRKVRDSSAPQSDREAYVEELVVRRELAHNFVFYSPDDYDSLNALPNWAKETMEKHADDPRPNHFTREQLENGATDDEAWNAAMKEMRERGFLPNYLRMYWGKQIIRWTNTYEYAYRTTLYLNNKYFMDGRDANSFTNVLWLFGLHDRAWTEREVFGKLRMLSKGGLERKFDVGAYLKRVSDLGE